MRNLRPVPGRYARLLEAENAKLVDKIHLDIYRRAQGVSGVIDDSDIREQDDADGDAIVLVGQISSYEARHGVALPRARIVSVNALPLRRQPRARKRA